MAPRDCLVEHNYAQQDGNTGVEPDSEDSEMDESIISVPRPTTPKSRRETQAKGPEQNGNQPTMPERDKGPSAAQDAELQTPRSQTDDANSTIAATSPLGDLSRPQTSRKSIRMYGTNARVWASKGYKSPVKGSPLNKIFDFDLGGKGNYYDSLS